MIAVKNMKLRERYYLMSREGEIYLQKEITRKG